jgi:hypothetical protein
MLRDRVKGALSGLIAVAAAITTSCTDIRPLLSNQRHGSYKEYRNVRIKGEPYYEYRIRGVLESVLPAYPMNLDNYRVNIELIENKSSVVYTEKQIAKKQLKIAAKVTVYDVNYNLISSKNVDSYSTYEVSDDLPYSDLASKKQATDVVLDDLAHSIVLVIIEASGSAAR